MGTATGMGGAGGGHPYPQGGAHGGGGGGAGYCIFTCIAVVRCGLHFTGLTLHGGGGGGGAHMPPTHGGAAAGITAGWGAGIAPVDVPAHTMPAAATTIRMNPRIPSFLTIPSSSFRQNHYI